MFDLALDTEHVFAEHGAMARTGVRRRLTFLACAAMLALAVAGRGAQAFGPVEDPPAERTQVEYVVQPGDSLWSIAVGVGDGRDPRVVVDAIERSNGLSGPSIVPGQVLRIPVRA